MVEVGTPSLDRLAGPLATAVGIGGLLYGALFVWIVQGSPDWVPAVWHALLTVGALLSIPVAVALYQLLRPVDEGLALTSLLLNFAAALGGAAHGAWNLAAQINIAQVGRDNASPDPGGILRYATAGLGLMLVGWLVVAAGSRGRNAAAGLRGPNAAAGLRGPNAAVGRHTVLPVRFGWLAIGSGVVLVYIYLGRLYDFVTPATKISLWAPVLYGLVLFPWLYLWLGRLLAPRSARVPSPDA